MNYNTLEWIGDLMDLICEVLIAIGILALMSSIGVIAWLVATK